MFYGYLVLQPLFTGAASPKLNVFFYMKGTHAPLLLHVCSPCSCGLEWCRVLAPKFLALNISLSYSYSCSLVSKPYPILQPFVDVTHFGFCHEEGTNAHMLLIFMQFYYRKESFFAAVKWGSLGTALVQQLFFLG